MKTRKVFIGILVILTFVLNFTVCNNDNIDNNNNNNNNNSNNDNNSSIDTPDWNEVDENLTTQEFVLQMGMGINLGNALDATGDWINSSNQSNFETAWGSPIITQAMIRGYADAGFSSLRIPVTWSNMMSADNTINPAVMNRVEQIVKWTIESGMIALVNTHHDSGWIIEKYPDDSVWVMKRFTAIWTQVSEHFKEYGDRLMFESMNEVGFDSIWTPWKGTLADKKRAFDIVNDLNKAFVDTVRASGGNNAKRHLLIEVYNAGLEYAYDPLFKMPNDPANRLAATVHYYTPAVFAILEEDADWGKARDTWGTAADLKELTDNMDLLKKNCVDKGIPIIVGEFAACGKNKTRDMKRLYAVKVAEAVYSRDMCPMLWDCQGDQYDRISQKWTDPLFLSEFMAAKTRK